jgi:hypothetical protein
MDVAVQEKTETETSREGPALGPSQSSGNKHAEHRRANKLRKKRAHSYAETVER